MISSYQDDIHLFWKRAEALYNFILKAPSDMKHIWEEKLKELMKQMGKYEVRRS